MKKRSKSRSKKSRSKSRGKRLAKQFVGSLNSRVRKLSRSLRKLREEKERILRIRSPTPRLRFFRTPVRIIYRTPYRARSPVHIHHHHAGRARTPRPRTPAAPWIAPPQTPNTTPSLRRKMEALQAQGLLTPGALGDDAVRAYRNKLRGH